MDEDDASYDWSLDDCDGSVLSSSVVGCGVGGGSGRVNGGGNRARVPFQELIDLSISFM